MNAVVSASLLPTGLINRLQNGEMKLCPSGTQSRTDTQIAFTSYRILTQTAAVSVSQLSAPEAGQSRAMRITQSQATAQRFGISQTIDNLNCQDLRESPLTASHRARLSASGRTMFAVLQWTGTLDTVPADVINDWTSASYIPGQFFISTVSVLNYGYLKTDAGVWASAPYIPYHVGASANNLIYVIWTEDAQSQNATLDLGLCQVIEGAEPLAFEHRPFQIESVIVTDSPTLLDDITTLQAQTWASASAPTMVQLTNNWTAGDGGGFFRFVSDDSSTADNGATLIVTASGRRYQRQMEPKGVYQAAWWGIIPNDAALAATNATRANAAFVYLVPIGGEFQFGAGDYSFSTALTIDESASGTELTRIRISGLGDGTTTLSFTSETNGFNYIGGSGVGLEATTGIQAMRIRYTGLSFGNVGVQIDNAADFYWRDVTITGFEYGIDGTDVLLATIQSCNIRANRRGYRLRYSDTSGVNAVAVRDTQLAGNYIYGGYVERASEFLVSGGSIEANGRTGSTPTVGGYGLKAVDCGYEGALGISLDSVYCEGNADTADVWIVQDNFVALSTINACSFLRFSNAFYTTNNILFTRSGAGITSQITVSGSAFKGISTYVEDAARRYIAAPALSVYDVANFYNSDTAKPNANITRGPWAGKVLGNGTAVTLPKGWTSAYVSAGIVTITHSINSVSDTYIVAVSAQVNTGIIAAAVVTGTNTFQVVCTDFAGTPTDATFGFSMSLIPSP